MVDEGPLTAAQIYEQITGGEGTRSLSDAQQAAVELTKRLAERGKQVYALTQKTQAGWTGAAGDAAARATLPLVQASADDAAHLARAQTAVNDQMDAFGTVKNSVKPVPDQPPELNSDDLRNVLTGQGWGSYNTKVTNWQADSQANIDAFSSYHTASTQNGTQMPTEYAQLTDSEAPISMALADGGDPKSPGAPVERHPGTGGPQSGFPPGGAAEWNRGPGSGAPGPGQPGPGTPGPGQPGGGYPGQPGGAPGSDETKANSYVPKPVMPPAASTGYQFGPTGEPISNLGNSGGNSGFGPYGSSGGFGPGTGGYGSSGGYRGGGVNEPGRGAGPGSGAQTHGERMPGGRGGMGGAAGARGANGMPMGAGGAGRGKKEEDKEKKAAPYLQNPDPDETFGGTDVKPMPPVIGERPPRR